jgi:outer membrane protein OmpA-like peptidoglycan-associated protein
VKQALGILVAAALAVLGVQGVAAAQTQEELGQIMGPSFNAFATGDFATAARLLPPLAERGYPDAQGMLTQMYRDGNGVPVNYVKAYMWCRVAVLHGAQTSTNDINWREGTKNLCRGVATHLTPRQVAKIDRAAAAWVPVNANGERVFMVFFDFEVRNMTAQAEEVAEAAAFSATLTHPANIDLVAHADAAEKHPLAVAEGRALAVKAYLIKHGVPATRISIRNAGTTDPLVPDPPGVREPQDRRVTMTIH